MDIFKRRIAALFTAGALIFTGAASIAQLPPAYAASIKVNGLSDWYLDMDGAEMTADGTIFGLQAGPYNSATGATDWKPYVYSKGSSDAAAWDGWQWSRTGEADWRPVKEGSVSYHVLRTVIENLPSPGAMSGAPTYELLISAFVVGTPIEAIEIPDGVAITSSDASQIVGSFGSLEFSYSQNALAIHPKQGASADTNAIAEQIIEAMTKVYGAPMMVVPNGAAIWSNEAIDASYTVANGTIGVQKR